MSNLKEIFNMVKGDSEDKESSSFGKEINTNETTELLLTYFNSINNSHISTILNRDLWESNTIFLNYEKEEDLIIYLSLVNQNNIVSKKKIVFIINSRVFREIMQPLTQQHFYNFIIENKNKYIFVVAEEILSFLESGNSNPMTSSLIREIIHVFNIIVNEQKIDCIYAINSKFQNDPSTKLILPTNKYFNSYTLHPIDYKSLILELYKINITKIIYHLATFDGMIKKINDNFYKKYLLMVQQLDEKINDQLTGNILELSNIVIKMFFYTSLQNDISQLFKITNFFLHKQTEKILNENFILFVDSSFDIPENVDEIGQNLFLDKFLISIQKIRQQILNEIKRIKNIYEKDKIFLFSSDEEIEVKIGEKFESIEKVEDMIVLNLWLECDNTLQKVYIQLDEIENIIKKCNNITYSKLNSNNNFISFYAINIVSETNNPHLMKYATILHILLKQFSNENISFNLFTPVKKLDLPNCFQLSSWEQIYCENEKGIVVIDGRIKFNSFTVQSIKKIFNRTNKLVFFFNINHANKEILDSIICHLDFKIRKETEILFNKQQAVQEIKILLDTKYNFLAKKDLNIELEVNFDLKLQHLITIAEQIVSKTSLITYPISYIKVIYDSNLMKFVLMFS